jgi:hypothetical protein
MLPLARAWLVLTLPCILSCSSGQSKLSANTSPQPSWTGTWSLVPGSAIPPEKGVVLPQNCEGSPEYWTIRQDNAQVLLEWHKARVASGAATNVVRVDFERARGQRRGVFASLDGAKGAEVIGYPDAPKPPAPISVTYELEYDPKTEHLAGTRNGAPVRFIRAELAPFNYSHCEPLP